MSPADFTPGTRVVVLHPSHLKAKCGVVTDRPMNNYDVAVLLDEDLEYGEAGALGFYADELAVEK